MILQKQNVVKAWAPEGLQKREGQATKTSCSQSPGGSTPSTRLIFLEPLPPPPCSLLYPPCWQADCPASRTHWHQEEPLRIWQLAGEGPACGTTQSRTRVPARLCPAPSQP
ncbi:transmembrane protein 144 [Platysternon megacephalum]|uniref:Transmembrane protein 144 n=1 Tax=Platysternon megacephalum TaxID=55544 RepID=A0A4D9F7G8_9SAUR|nr:transmembrane protein 144 [Platysternon megacephalum]